MKKKKNQVISVPTSKSLVKSKTKKTALPTKTKAKTLVKPRSVLPKVISKSTSPVLYFQCMSDCCQKGLKGQKITQIAKHCKTNASTLVIKRTKQIKELKKALSVVSKFTSSLEKALVNH